MPDWLRSTNGPVLKLSPEPAPTAAEPVPGWERHVQDLNRWFDSVWKNHAHVLDTQNGWIKTWALAVELPYEAVLDNLITPQQWHEVSVRLLCEQAHEDFRGLDCRDRCFYWRRRPEAIFEKDLSTMNEVTFLVFRGAVDGVAWPRPKPEGAAIQRMRVYMDADGAWKQRKD